MSEFATNDKMRAGLREPFPRELIGTLPRAGVALDFVGHAAVTDRLNKVAPDWSYTVLRTVDATINGVPHLLAMQIAMTVGGVTREEWGDVDRPSHYGMEAQVALGNAIRRAAMRFGVGIDLWSKEDLTSVTTSPAVTPPSAAGGSPAAPTSAAGQARAQATSKPRPAAAQGSAGAVATPSPAAAPAPSAPAVAPQQKIVVPPDSTPAQHFPMWETRGGVRRCIYPGCLIHKVANAGGAA